MLILGAFLITTSLIADCGPAVSPATTQAIIQVESGGNPLAIGDNTARRSFSPKTKAEAIELAARLISQGHNIDLGLMQVNSCHIKAMKLTLEELFDPCGNVRIGTTILADFYRQHKTADPVQSLFRALSAYNTGQAWKGTGYINKILDAAKAGYRVLTPPVQFPVRIAEDAKSFPSPPAATENLAEHSPLFFDNLSSSMRAGEL